MIPCLVIGDSIAAGLYRAMPECRARIVGGASAAVFDARTGSAAMDAALVTIISLGSNQGPADDEAPLRAIRSRIAGNVVWLLPPSRPAARATIIRIAAALGDRVVDVLPPGRPAPGDATTMHIHPSPEGNRRLAQRIRDVEEVTPPSPTVTPN
jgi:hypothetical protein